MPLLAGAETEDAISKCLAVIGRFQNLLDRDPFSGARQFISPADSLEGTYQLLPAKIA